MSRINKNTTVLKNLEKLSSCSQGQEKSFWHRQLQAACADSMPSTEDKYRTRAGLTMLTNPAPKFSLRSKGKRQRCCKTQLTQRHHDHLQGTNKLSQLKAPKSKIWVSHGYQHNQLCGQPWARNKRVEVKLKRNTAYSSIKHKNAWK